MIRGIVFDLDGTLWNTEEAYIHSYKRLAKEFSFSPLSDEEVKACLGIKLEGVIARLYADCPNKEELGIKSVQYVAEYCIKNPRYYSDDIDVLFEKLSKNFDLYIMSNCPRNFLDAFLQVSGLSKYVKNTFSITEGSKKEHLKKITNDYKERILFVGDSQFDYDEIENHDSIHFCYAKYGYLDCNKYEYHINKLDDILQLAGKISRKERMIDNENYKIYSCGDTNVTVINFNDYSMFGFIEFNKKEEFDSVLKDIKNECKNKIIGPIDGKTWYPYRVSLDNYDWRLYPDCINNKDIVDSLLENGFEIFQTYSSTLSKVNEKIWALSKRAKLPPCYTTSIVFGEDCYKYIKDIYEISIKVFEKADHYRPISYEDFEQIYMEGIRSISPSLFLIFKDEKLVAFNYAYEDPEKRFYVCKTIGIREEERNRLVLMKLLDIGYEYVINVKGYDKILHHFQNDRTKTMELMSKGYEIKKKSFGLFKYENK